MLRRWMAGLLALLLITQGLVPIATARMAGDEDSSGGRTMRVTANSLNLRAGAGTDQTVLRSLSRGTLVAAVEERGEWSRVRLVDGTTGWVSAKYLEPADPAATPRAPGQAAQPARTPEGSAGGASGSMDGGGGAGGSTLGAIAKWGCLAGALVAGGLWYTEHSSGNDTYDEYKELFQDGEMDAAEAKYDETIDHDDQAQVYAIAGGVLLGLFALQQFVLGGGDEDQAGADAGPRIPSLSWEPGGREVRLTLVRACW